MTRTSPSTPEQSVSIPVGRVRLPGSLALPPSARGLVLFVHGGGSSRSSPRNRFVAEDLGRAGLGTLRFDLLTPAEDTEYETRFDIDLLTQRLLAATEWIPTRPDAADLGLAYFGASTGAAAALRAAAARPGKVQAIVSRGGRPDLAQVALAAVRAPTLLIVGGHDEAVLELNREALARLTCPKELAVVPGATHLFEEPGALARVADLAAAWFLRHLAAADRPPEADAAGAGRA